MLSALSMSEKSGIGKKYTNTLFRGENILFQTLFLRYFQKP